jgi:hypothetical protein
MSPDDSTVERFPFGATLAPVQPSAASARRILVLGVYASALHARWKYGSGRRDYVAALAVDNEPTPFWDGRDQEDRIASVRPPFGQLLPTPQNGCSGKALDEHYLQRLNLLRGDCWITDLHNRYLAQRAQRLAFERAYRAVGAQAPPWTLPPRTGTVHPSKARLRELQAEFTTASPRWVITLGAEPLDVLGLPRLDKATYGRASRAVIWGREVGLLAFTHPRNAGRLGAFSQDWYDRHKTWSDEEASTVAKQIAS